jgi:lipopolysaccharide/colanic/teichoic acid biosynthesis glycosyltransferase
MDTAPLNAFSTTSRPHHEAGSLDRDWTVLPVPVAGAAPAVDFERLVLPDNGDLWRSLAMAAKRLVDLTGALAGLVMLAPLLFVVAVLIRLDSPGPVLFRQRRLGRYGRPFWIFKFRTMRADAERQLVQLEACNEAAQGVLFKMRNDPRVTRLGHYLRRTNLDELPQLWNVLMGEMSLVGPRPLQLRDCERLQARAPVAFARRLEFTPGLTGAWQIGRSSVTDSEHLLEFDLEYIENWSLGRDLHVIYRTFFVLLTAFLKRD